MKNKDNAQKLCFFISRCRIINTFICEEVVMSLEWQALILYALGIALVSSTFRFENQADNFLFKNSLLGVISKFTAMGFLFWGFYIYSWWKLLFISLALLTVLNVIQIRKLFNYSPYPFYISGAFLCLYYLKGV